MSWFGIYLYHVTNCSSAPRYWNNGNKQANDFDLVHVWLVFDHIAGAGAGAEAKAKPAAEAEAAAAADKPTQLLCSVPMPHKSFKCASCECPACVYVCVCVDKSFPKTNKTVK